MREHGAMIYDGRRGTKKNISLEGLQSKLSMLDSRRESKASANIRRVASAPLLRGRCLAQLRADQCA
jgi:hypothetical protein